MPVRQVTAVAIFCFVRTYAALLSPSPSGDNGCVGRYSSYYKSYASATGDGYCCAFSGGAVKVGSGSSPSACSSYCANPNEQAQKIPLEALWLGDPTTIYDAMCQCLICMSLPTPPGATPTPAVTPAPSLPAVAGEYYVAARPRICDTDPTNPTVVSFPLQDEALCQAVARTLGFPIIGPLQRTNLNPRGCY